MTPLEELQAAHKRLSELRQASEVEAPGAWRRLQEGSPADAVEVYASFNSVAEFDSAEQAALVVALHRTIDPHLALLNQAIAMQQAWDDGIGTLSNTTMALPLARAINGEAS